jgi:hypothetical protein
MHEQDNNANEQQLDHPEATMETAEDKESQATEHTRRLTSKAKPIERL